MVKTVSDIEKHEIEKEMRKFVREITELSDSIKDKKVRLEDKKALARLSETDIPEEGRPLGEVIGELKTAVFSNQTLVNHPRCFSCVPGPASLVSWLGEAMTEAYNPHLGGSKASPAAAEIEKKLIAWLCGLAGYGEGSGGVFVSGGSMANLTALAAARDAKLSDFRDRERAVAYISDQTHSSVKKGLKIIGFCENNIRTIETDEEFSMKAEKLSEAVREDAEAGRKPFLAVATAGTTNTGSIDPLREISEICKSNDMWLHVDGAYGGSLLACEKYRGRLDGIELSDSMSWDAHKWLMQTYACSMVLVKDRKNLLRSFSANPEYLKDAAGEEVNFWDLGPELTRPARCIKLWTTLQTKGTKAMGEMIAHGVEMAEFAERVVRSYPFFEIMSCAKQAVLNFRYAPAGIPEKSLDRLNSEIAALVTESGYAEIFTTKLRGKTVIRLCMINPETTGEDIIETVSRLAYAAALCLEKKPA